MMLMATAVFSAAERGRKLPRVRAPLALAALLVVAPAAWADPVDEASAAVALHADRARFFDALVTARWERGDPRVRQIADEVTAAALPLVDAGGALREAAIELVAEAAGDSLGRWLRQHDGWSDGLSAAWLRERVDPELEAAAVARPASDRLALAFAVVPRRPDLAASLLRGLIADEGQGEDACAVALALPPARRAEFVLRQPAPRRGREGPWCFSLFASVASQRRSLAAVAARNLAPSGAEDDRSAGLRAAFVALSTSPGLAAVIAAHTSRTAPARLLDEVADVAAVGPAIDRLHPRVNAALARLEERAGGPLGALRALRVGADAALLPWLWRRAEQPAVVADERSDAISRLALALPHRPEVEDQAVERLARVRPRLRAHGGQRVVPRLDAWTDAIAQVRSCGSDACLRAVIASGSSEAATRALVVLGASALTDPDTAAVVVTRFAAETPPPRGSSLLVTDESSMFRRVALVLGGDCPAGLRALVGIAHGWGAEAPAAEFTWFASFLSRCSARAAGDGR